MVLGRCRNLKFPIDLEQGCATLWPRATCGPPNSFCGPQVRWAVCKKCKTAFDK